MKLGLLIVVWLGRDMEIFKKMNQKSKHNKPKTKTNQNNKTWLILDRWIWCGEIEIPKSKKQYKSKTEKLRPKPKAKHMDIKSKNKTTLILDCWFWFGEVEMRLQYRKANQKRK